MAQGDAEEIKQNDKSITGKYLSGKLKIEVPTKRRKFVKSRTIDINGATENNLKNISVKFPLRTIYLCYRSIRFTVNQHL